MHKVILALAVVVLLMLIFASGAARAMDTLSRGDCMILGDLGNVSMSAAKHGIPRDKIQGVLEDVYVIPDDGWPLAKAIADKAYAEASKYEKATDYGLNLYKHCVQNGNLGGFLGKKVRMRM